MSMMMNRHLLMRGAGEEASPEAAHLNESGVNRFQPDSGEGVQSFFEKREPSFTSDVSGKQSPATYAWRFF